MSVLLAALDVETVYGWLTTFVLLFGVAVWSSDYRQARVEARLAALEAVASLQARVIGLLVQERHGDAWSLLEEAGREEGEL